IPNDTNLAVDFIKRLFEQNPEFKLQLIVDLQKENLDYYKKIMSAGVELRHIDGNKVSFAISKDEYLAAPLAAAEEQIASGAAMPGEIVWSNRKDIISQFEQIFEMMWKNSTKAAARVKELEEGIEPESTTIIDDMQQVYEIGTKMTEDCREEVLMILASDKTVLRNEILFKRLADRQRKLGFRIQILTPSLSREASRVLPGAAWRKIEQPIYVTILIYDRRRMFITQYLNAEAKTTEEAVSTNIYCTSKPTIAGMASVFEALWGEAELREREEVSRKQAELLQDVLTHDIRNFNQISRMGTELISERLQEDSQFREIAKNVLGAIDGSTELVEKAKKLGRIISERDNPQLQGIDLIHSIEKSLLLVKKIYPGKQIKEIRRVVTDDSPPSEISVLADDLLDDVFINLFSNSAKFSREQTVLIDILIEEKKRSPESDESYWQVTVKDSGPGIPKEQRKDVFERYSKGKKGSGLGLAIVHALVAGRYGGQITLENTTENIGGAIFRLLLKRA
ncbi:MAG: sensor histidine kinase, partial [Nitrososphaerales archaeon]